MSDISGFASPGLDVEVTQEKIRNNSYSGSTRSSRNSFELPAVTEIEDQEDPELPPLEAPFAIKQESEAGFCGYEQQGGGDTVLMSETET